MAGDGGGGDAGGSEEVQPSTRITDGPPARGRHRRVRFEFDADRADGFQCRLDDGEWRDCASPERFRVDRGSHRFRVRASYGGVADPTPASHGFRVVPR